MTFCRFYKINLLVKVPVQFIALSKFGGIFVQKCRQIGGCAAFLARGYNPVLGMLKPFRLSRFLKVDDLEYSLIFPSQMFTLRLLRDFAVKKVNIKFRQ